MAFELKLAPLAPEDEVGVPSTTIPGIETTPPGEQIPPASTVTAEQRPVSATESAYGKADSMGSQLLYGVNDFIGTFLGTPIVDALSLAFTGERNPEGFLRFVNSGDYERVRQVDNAIGRFLNLTVGEGDKVGPQGFAEQVVRSTGEFGAFGGGAGAITNLAAKAGTRGVKKGADILSKNILAKGPQTKTEIVRKTLLEPFIKNPNKALATETTLGALSGAGLEAGGEGAAQVFGEEARPYGELIGGFTAPLGGVVLKEAVKKPISAVAQFSPVVKSINFAKEKGGPLIETAKDKVTGAFKGEVKPETSEARKVEKKLGEVLQKEVDDPRFQENIRKAEQAEELIGPFAPEGKVQFSPAELTQNPRLRKAQLESEQKMQPDVARSNALRKSNIIEGGKRFIDDTFETNLNDSPMLIYNKLGNRFETTIGTIKNKINNVYDKIGTLLNDGVEIPVSQATKAEQGSTLRNYVAEAEQTVKKSMNDLAEKLKIDKDVLIAKGKREQLGKFQDDLNTQMQTKTDLAGKRHPLVEQFLNYKISEKSLSFQDWKRFVDQVSSELSKAINFKAADDMLSLTALKKTLDDIGTQFGKTKEKFNIFQKRYNDEYIGPFKDKVVTKILKKEIGSTKETPRYVYPDETVAESFLRNTETAKSFKNIFGKDGFETSLYKENIDTLEKVIGNQLVDAAKFNRETGTLNTVSMRKYIKQKENVLKELGLFDKFNNPTTQIKALQDSIIRNNNRLKKISDNVLYKNIANAAKTDDPDAYLDDILFKPKQVAALKKQVNMVNSLARKEGNDEIVKRYKSAVMNKILEKVGPSVFDEPKKFKGTLIAFEDKLKIALGEDHFNDLLIVSDAFDRALTTKIDEIGTGIGDVAFTAKLQEMTGISIPSFTARLIALGERRLSQEVGAAYAITRMVNQAQEKYANKLMEEVIVNGELAKLLAKKQPNVSPETLANGTATVPKDFVNKVRGYLFQLGVPTEEETLAEPTEIKINIGPQGAAPTEDTGVQIATAPNPMPPTPPVTPDMIPQSNVPVQPMGQSGMASVKPSAQELFPFDPTTAAIARRTPQRSGIASLV